MHNCFLYFYILIYTIKCVYAACFVFATNENGRQSTKRNENIAKSNPTSEKQKNDSAKQRWIESTKNTPKSQQQTETKHNRKNKKNKNQIKQTKIKEQKYMI